MERAWPFENRVEPEAPIRSLNDFVTREGAGVEAVVVRIGLNGAQLLLVGPSGRWRRWVYPSVDEAVAEASSAGLPVHSDDFPEQLRVRMNSYRRPVEDFDRAPYPEQGRAGPVSYYPENRPRRVDHDSTSGRPD